MPIDNIFHKDYYFKKLHNYHKYDNRISRP